MKVSFKRIVASASLVGLAALVSGCQNQVDKYIDNYFQRKGTQVVEKAIDEIVKKKREEARRAEEPTLDEMLKHRTAVSMDNAPEKGAKDAALTIVEFSDFECPFCGRVEPTVEAVMKQYDGKVRLAYRHNPLPFHPHSMPAAKAAVAAQKQGKFWEMHDKLFSNQQALTDANFKKWAKELKLNVAKFEKDMKDPSTQKQIDEDASFARSNGAGGTPSFFIGPMKDGKVDAVLLVGAQPEAKFKEVIDALLKGGNAPAAPAPAAPAAPAPKK